MSLNSLVCVFYYVRGVYPVDLSGPYVSRLSELSMFSSVQDICPSPT